MDYLCEQRRLPLVQEVDADQGCDSTEGGIRGWSDWSYTDMGQVREKVSISISVFQKISSGGILGHRHMDILHTAQVFFCLLVSYPREATDEGQTLISGY